MVEKENPEDDHDVGDLSARLQGFGPTCATPIRKTCGSRDRIDCGSKGNWCEIFVSTQQGSSPRRWVDLASIHSFPQELPN